MYRREWSITSQIVVVISSIGNGDWREWSITSSIWDGG